MATKILDWVSQRPVFKELALNNAHVHAVMKLASHENWTVDEFLAECVVVLAKAKDAMSKEYLDYRMTNPPAVRIVDKEYRYVGPGT